MPKTRSAPEEAGPEHPGRQVRGLCWSVPRALQVLFPFLPPLCRHTPRLTQGPDGPTVTCSCSPGRSPSTRRAEGTPGVRAEGQEPGLQPGQCPATGQRQRRQSLGPLPGPRPDPLRTPAQEESHGSELTEPRRVPVPPPPAQELWNFSLFLTLPGGLLPPAHLSQRCNLSLCKDLFQPEADLLPAFPFWAHREQGSPLQDVLVL